MLSGAPLPELAVLNLYKSVIFLHKSVIGTVLVHCDIDARSGIGATLKRRSDMNTNLAKFALALGMAVSTATVMLSSLPADAQVAQRSQQYSYGAPGYHGGYAVEPQNNRDPHDNR
jgi:hypothetical protein